MDACRLLVVLRQVDGCHHTGTHAHHHAHAVDKHHDGGYQIDGGQSCLTDAVPHKDAVGQKEGHVEQHPQQGGEEDAGKERPDFLVGEINVVPVVVHIVAFISGMSKGAGADMPSPAPLAVGLFFRSDYAVSKAFLLS